MVCEVTDKLQALVDDDYIAAPSFMSEFYDRLLLQRLVERGYSLRIDVMLAYDLDQLLEVRDEEGSFHGYRFENPDEKQAALLGVVSIL